MRKLFLALLLLALLSGAGLLVLWFAFGAPTDGIRLIVNGHELSMPELSGWHAAAGGLAVLLALCIVALVLPFTLLLAMLLPLLLILGALLLVLGAVLGAGALALSPLVIPLVLLWWLWRRSQRTAAASARAAAGPTIDV